MRALVVVLSTLFPVALAQPFMNPHFNPLDERYFEGPFREIISSTHYTVGWWREYDSQGLLVNAAPQRLGTALGPGPNLEVVAFDAEHGVVTFSEPIPQGLSHIQYSWLNIELTDYGRPDPENEHRFVFREVRGIDSLQEGDVVSSGQYLPYVSRFAYSPNRVTEERVWQDGTVVSTLTYEYGRHGLKELREVDFEGRRSLRACFEYDSRGKLLTEVTDCNSMFLRRSYVYTYDGDGRITRVRGSEESVEIGYEERAESVLIELVVDGSRGQSTRAEYFPGDGQVHFESWDLIGVHPMSPRRLELALWAYNLDLPADPDPFLWVIPMTVAEPFTEGIMQFDDQGRLISITGKNDQGDRRDLHIEYGSAGKWTSIALSQPDVSEDESDAFIWSRTTTPLD